MMKSTAVAAISLSLLLFFTLSDACYPYTTNFTRRDLTHAPIYYARQAQEGEPTVPKTYVLKGACKPKNLLGGAACLCHNLWKNDELTEDLLDFCTRLFDMPPSELLPKCPPRFFKRDADPGTLRANFLRQYIFKSASCFINGRVGEPETTPEAGSGPMDEEGATNKCIMCLLCFKLGSCVSA